MRHWLLMLGLATALSGCAGSLGINHRTTVDIESSDIADLDLFVAPLRGSWTDSEACSLTDSGFGCDRALGSDWSELRFTTNSEASTSPYYVYVRNTASYSVRFALTVYMDGFSTDGQVVKLYRAYTIPGNTVWKVAEIRRASADDP